MKEVIMECEYQGRTKLNDEWDCNKWHVTLEYDGREIEILFHTGLAIAEPDLDSVLHALIMDGEANDYDNFEEWASNFGYDTDSRKAEQTYLDCKDNGKKLDYLLGDDKQQFVEKYEDF